MRNALNALRDATREIFLEHCSELIKDPLAFREQVAQCSLTTRRRSFDL